MCEIGKPIEIVDVEPLSLPAPLPRREENPAEQPVTVEVPVGEKVPVPEGATGPRFRAPEAPPSRCSSGAEKAIAV